MKLEQLFENDAEYVIKIFLTGYYFEEINAMNMWPMAALFKGSKRISHYSELAGDTSFRVDATEPFQPIITLPAVKLSSLKSKHDIGELVVHYIRKALKDSTFQLVRNQDGALVDTVTLKSKDFVNQINNFLLSIEGNLLVSIGIADEIRSLVIAAQNLESRKKK